MDSENIYAPPEADLEITNSPSSEVQLAARSARFSGAFIDGLLGLVTTLPIMYFGGFWDKAMSGQVSLVDYVIYAAVGFVIFLLLHGYLLAKNGQTIGKKLAGTRIVSASNGEILPLWKVVLIRSILPGLVVYIPAIGQLLLLVDYLFIYRKNKRCVHDLIADTNVVKVT